MKRQNEKNRDWRSRKNIGMEVNDFYRKSLDSRIFVFACTLYQINGKKRYIFIKR